MLGLRQKGRGRGLGQLGLADALAAVEALEQWTATTYVGESKLTPARRSSAARRLAAVVPPTVRTASSSRALPTLHSLNSCGRST